MRTWTWLSISVAGALLGLAGRAAAQDCASNEDCLKGFTCEVVGASGCGFACSSDDPNCAPPPDFMCDDMEIKGCVPGPCASDADCEDGMVCFEQEAYDCPQVAMVDCPPDADCVKPEPTPCEPSTVSSCVPRYAVPCTEDADCGDGFDCIEDKGYSCSGSAPSMGGGSDPGSAPTPTPGEPAPMPDGDPAAPEPRPLPPDTCSEEPLGTFHCEARQIECADDAGCPTDWSCVENYSRAVCGGATPAEPAPAPEPLPVPAEACPDAVPELCRVCADGSCGKPVCVGGGWEFECGDPAMDDPAPMPIDPPVCEPDPSVPARVCAPPFFDYGWGYPGGVAADGSVIMATGVAAGDPAAPSANPRADAENGAEGPGKASDGDDSPSFGSGELGEGPMTMGDSGACAVSAVGARTGSTLSALGLLGLALLGARRRRRG